ncbi:MAG: SpoIID/LytB domain-containing protein [Anaerolineae bacterium]
MPVHRTRRQFLGRLAAGTLGAVTLGLSARLGNLAAAAQVLQPLGRLEGYTREMGSGKPLAGVELSVAGLVTTSDPDGYYLFQLPPDSYELHAQLPGYIGMSAVRLVVAADLTTTCSLEMIPVSPAPALAEVISLKMLPNAGTGLNAITGGQLNSIASIPSTLRVVTNYTYPPPADWTPNVVTMNIDEYLRGVVPSEMPAYWMPEALKAQAVAARSYSLAAAYHAPYADICTTTHCQAWNNIHYDSTDQAITATTGVVVYYGGYIASTFYFGHCMGHTLDSEDAYPEYPNWYVPYCRGVECSPCLGNDYLYGHGVGMCQEGAEGYARDHGWSYAQILNHYYTGISLTTPGPVAISITAPAANAALRGVVLITASVSSDPDYIDFFADRNGSSDSYNLYRATAAPWQMRLNTFTLPPGDGAYTLRAVASRGGAVSSASVPVTIDNTPPVGTAAAPSGWLRSPGVPVTLSWNADCQAVQFSNNWRWEGEALLHYQGIEVADTGYSPAYNGLAWEGRENIDSANTWFGPYTCALPTAPQYQAYYRIKTRSRYPTVDAARLDVSDDYGTRVLGECTVSSEDLPFDMTYEEVKLPFNYQSRGDTCAPGAKDGLEFRTHYLAARDLYLDCVTVYSAPRPLTSTVFWPAELQNGAQTILVRFLDAAGNTCDRTLIVKIDLTLPSLVQKGANSASAQDMVSGLDPASARWANSGDGGKTWSGWQQFVVPPCAVGEKKPVTLQAPIHELPDVRFMISDLAGNTAFTRGTATDLPLVFRQVS